MVHSDTEQNACIVTKVTTVDIDFSTRIEKLTIGTKIVIVSVIVTYKTNCMMNGKIT